MIQPISRPGLSTALLLAAIPMLALGCDRPRSIGEQSQIIVGVQPAAWEELEEDLKEALQPSTFTVRDERVFDIAHANPAGSDWNHLRVMRQVLVIGPPEDPTVAQAISRHRGELPTPPAVFQVRNVWAQNQVVTVALLPAGESFAAARPLLPRIGQTYLQQFEDYARTRMFVTGLNQELADTLRQRAGFSLIVPRVYRNQEIEPGVYVFRNDQPDPSSLIRNITVAARPSAGTPVTPELASEWRADLAARHTQPPQVTEPLIESQQVEVAGRSALQIQGVWSNPPGQWPAAGPFLTRLIECGDRVFLVDAWLYAPRFSKYEYMFQLKTILDTFEC